MMSIRLFVSVSAAFFAAWLGVSYFREVPADSYQQLNRSNLPVSAEAGTDAPAPVATPLSSEEAATEVAMAD